MKYLIISLLVTLVTGLKSKKFDSSVHQEYLHLSKDQALFVEQKSLESVFKIGREGSKQCLSFLHIPKNAGSAMEKIGQHYVKAVDTTARHWGMFDHSLKCNGWHMCNFTYTKDGKKETATCPKWHVPPHLDQQLAASYTRDGCETFCVVRSPTDKFFSELKFFYANDGAKEGLKANCSKSWYHDAADLAATRTRETPYWDNCHFVPQSEYVYGKDPAPKQNAEYKKVFCNHQLRMENLEEDFASLMKKFDIPLALSKNKEATAQGAKKFTCELPEEDRDEEKVAHDFIFDYYSQDLKNFEYAK